jgi:hypothetical protein
VSVELGAMDSDTAVSTGPSSAVIDALQHYLSCVVPPVKLLCCIHLFGYGGWMRVGANEMMITVCFQPATEILSIQ